MYGKREIETHIQGSKERKSRHIQRRERGRERENTRGRDRERLFDF